MRKLKEGFRKVFLTAMVISLFFASCKQPSSDSGTENVTVTVKKDAHVTKAPDSFTLAKGSKLGFTALKDKMELEFTPTWLLAKITLNDSSGTEITNTNPYTFNADTTIYISSRKEGTGEKLELTELKVAGKSVTIQDVMEAGKTREAKVLIEAKVSPADATIDYEPALVDGFWKLILGKDNQLKIKVKRGSDSKEYTLNIERLDADAPILKKLTVGKKTKEGAEITREMMFTAFQDANEVEVKTETDPEDAPITFSPALSNGKLTLSGDETTLTITVGVAPKTNTYTVKVKKLVASNVFFDTLFVYGGKKEGVSVDAKEEQTKKIIDGEDVILELPGTKATILVASKVKVWTSFKINGMPIEIYDYGIYKSVAYEYIKLLAKGEVIDINIEASDATSIAELNFKIKRNNDTVDVPVDKLYIRDENVITENEMLVSLNNGSNPNFDGAEPTRIELGASENVMKSATIDGSVCTLVTQKKDANDKEVWLIEGVVTGVAPSGKDVTVVIEPIDTDSYHPITWKFHLNYKASEPIRVSYEINGKGIYKLDYSFIQGVKNGTNPLIDVESKFLNVKLICGGRIANIKFNDDVIQGDALIADGQSYILTHSFLLDSSEKQIEIKINPLDVGVYSPVTLKFRAKGNGAIEKIVPTFEEISGDRNLSKTAFLDKLTGTDIPLYRVIGTNADITIAISGYEYDFLCKEVKINGEKTEVKIEKGLYTNAYKIKKSFIVSETSPTDVKIEFIASEGLANDLTWQFKLQGGGIAPSIPERFINIFKINGVGGYSNPLPKELTEHLTDGTKPLYLFAGEKALVEVGSYNVKLIGKVTFKLDGVQKHEMVPVEELYTAIAKYEFEISDNNEHTVELIMKPQDKKYSNLIYTFRLKRS